MKIAIAIGTLGLALTAATARAQTAQEEARIVCDFEQSVVHYAQHHQAPAPKIFTLPVAMVFRRRLAQARVARGAAGVPTALRDALPALPDMLEYRLIGNDLVLRDTNADVIVAVLRDALGHHMTVRR